MTQLWWQLPPTITLAMRLRIQNSRAANCGSVGKSVDSETKGLQIESSRRQNFTVSCCKDKNKEKGSGNELGVEHLYLPYSLTCHAYAA